jgi:hypothetical protein
MNFRELIRSTVILLVTLPDFAYSADLSGSVSMGPGQPVAGVQIQLQDPSGKTVAQELTDSSGHYGFTGLTPGQYECVLDPLDSSIRGGSAHTNVAPEGTTLDWKVATNVSPVSGSFASFNGPTGGSASQVGSAAAGSRSDGDGQADPLLVHSGPIGNPVGGPPNHGVGSGSSSE